MPKLTASSEEIKGLPAMSAGLVTVRCDGFKPKFSKDKGSINLNPILKVTNHPEYNDRIVFENLNTKGKWVWKDFCHAFGVEMLTDAQGEFEFPGDFVGPDDKPEDWQYNGPLLGQLGQVYLVQSSYQNEVNNKIDFYVCKVTGCAEKHSAHLVKS